MRIHNERGEAFLLLVIVIMFIMGGIAVVMNSECNSLTNPCKKETHATTGNGTETEVTPMDSKDR